MTKAQNKLIAQTKPKAQTKAPAKQKQPHNSIVNDYLVNAIVNTTPIANIVNAIVNANVNVVNNVKAPTNQLRMLGIINMQEAIDSVWEATMECNEDSTCHMRAYNAEFALSLFNSKAK